MATSIGGQDTAGGLTSAEVADRVARGQVNLSPAATDRSGWQILARNTFTWLNFLFAILGVASLATGAGPDATFLAIAVINTAVGTAQELRAKRTLDALAVINAPQVRAVRDGATVELGVSDVVIDDLMELVPGDQVVADAVVIDGWGEVDESLATGESDPVPKEQSARLLSGSWVVSGALRARVTAVGADSYAGRLAGEARRFSLTGSELMGGINTILRWLSLAMVVIGPALLIRQLQVQPWRPAVRATVAGLVGMIPEGLVLLTTLAFVTAAVRLGSRRVLVQELPAVESLARVDALCTDKTGTLTEGRVQWGGIILPAGASAGEEARAALAELASARGGNATLAAIAAGAGSRSGWEPVAEVPFSSARKWSGASYAGHGTWVLGAPEMVTAADPLGLMGEVRRLASGGARVLVLAHSNDSLVGEALPTGLTLTAVIHLVEQLRPDARDTLEYFARQGVTVRVVSGDSPATVGAIASRVGLSGPSDAVDARHLPSDPEALADVVEDHRAFGRVTPDQKRDMVDALRRRGHVIAMTGDGVNDTVALKDADLGIAMGSGSAVARGVAQLVLLDDQFAALPAVVSEGRRVLRNIERVAALFLIKNVYSIVISVVVSIAGWPYPLLPRHLSLISGLAIGLPGFFLALSPSEERFQPGFVRRVTSRALVAGISCGTAVILAYAAAREESTVPDRARTSAVIVIIVVSLWVLLEAARPLRPWKAGMVAVIAAAFAAAFVTPGVNTFFSLEHPPDLEVTVQSVGLGAAACAAIFAIGRLVDSRRPHRHRPAGGNPDGARAAVPSSGVGAGRSEMSD